MRVSLVKARKREKHNSTPSSSLKKENANPPKIPEANSIGKKEDKVGKLVNGVGKANHFRLKNTMGRNIFLNKNWHSKK